MASYDFGSVSMSFAAAAEGMTIAALAMREVMVTMVVSPVTATTVQGDLQRVLDQCSNDEVQTLRHLVNVGEIDGTNYGGCVLGRIAQMRRVSYHNQAFVAQMHPNPTRPIEVYVTNIRIGHTPCNNQQSAQLLAWLDAELDARGQEREIATPEFFTQLMEQRRAAALLVASQPARDEIQWTECRGWSHADRWDAPATHVDGRLMPARDQPSGRSMAAASIGLAFPAELAAARETVQLRRMGVLQDGPELGRFIEEIRDACPTYRGDPVLAID